MASYKNMSLEELEVLSRDIATRRYDLSIEHKAVAAAIEKKRSEVSAHEKVANMGDAEKAALLQAINAEGIGSGEEIGEI